jgi:hypothetical protein
MPYDMHLISFTSFEDLEDLLRFRFGRVGHRVVGFTDEIEKRCLVSLRGDIRLGLLIFREFSCL